MSKNGPKEQNQSKKKVDLEVKEEMAFSLQEQALFRQEKEDLAVSVVFLASEAYHSMPHLFTNKPKRKFCLLILMIWSRLDVANLTQFS